MIMVLAWSAAGLAILLLLGLLPWWESRPLWIKRLVAVACGPLVWLLLAAWWVFDRG